MLSQKYEFFNTEKVKILRSYYKNVTTNNKIRKKFFFFPLPLTSHDPTFIL